MKIFLVLLLFGLFFLIAPEVNASTPNVDMVTFYASEQPLDVLTTDWKFIEGVTANPTCADCTTFRRTDRFRILYGPYVKGYIQLRSRNSWKNFIDGWKVRQDSAVISYWAATGFYWVDKYNSFLGRTSRQLKKMKRNTLRLTRQKLHQRK